MLELIEEELARFLPLEEQAKPARSIVEGALDALVTAEDARRGHEA